MHAMQATHKNYFTSDLGAVQALNPKIDWNRLDLACKCRVPCDHVPICSWAFFRAREVMRGLIESFKVEQPR
jgi:hypothetical protein